MQFLNTLGAGEQEVVRVDTASSSCIVLSPAPVWIPEQSEDSQQLLLGPSA